MGNIDRLLTSKISGLSLVSMTLSTEAARDNLPSSLQIVPGFPSAGRFRTTHEFSLS